MTDRLINIGIIFIAGLVAGLYISGIKHDKFKQELQQETINQLIQQQEIAAFIEQIGSKNYEDYIAASSIEPVVERVFIKSACDKQPTSTNTDREVGGGEATTQAELPARTVERITALVAGWESDILKCEAQRNSLLEKIKAYNGKYR